MSMHNFVILKTHEYFILIFYEIKKNKKFIDEIFNLEYHVW